MKKKMNTRKLKVHERYNNNAHSYVKVPEICLKGKWLEEAGFAPNDYILVSCEEGKIIITPREPEVVSEIVKTVIKDGRSMVAERKLIYG